MVFNSLRGFAVILALVLVPLTVRAAPLMLSSNDYLNISSAGSTGVVGGTPVTNTQSNYTTISLSGSASLTLSTSGSVIVPQSYGPNDAIANDGSGSITVTGGTVYADVAADLDISGTGTFLVSRVFSAGSIRGSITSNRRRDVKELIHHKRASISSECRCDGLDLLFKKGRIKGDTHQRWDGV